MTEQRLSHSACPRPLLRALSRVVAALIIALLLLWALQVPCQSQPASAAWKDRLTPEQHRASATGQDAAAIAALPRPAATKDLETAGNETVPAAPEPALASSQAVTLAIEPQATRVWAGEEMSIGVHVAGAVDMGAFEFTLAYDAALVEVTSVQLGDFLGSTDRTVTPIGQTINVPTGTVTFGAYSLGSTPEGPSGSGVLAVVSLRGKAPGCSELTFTAAQVTNRQGIEQQPLHLRHGEICVDRDRTYCVEWVSVESPSTLVVGERREEIPATIRNCSNWTWPYTGSNRVRLSYHWWDSEGKEAPWDGARTDLHHNLRPGQTITLLATVKAPKEPGTYTLEWDMVEEWITWFEWRGSPTLEVSVTVQPRIYRADWVSHNTPDRMLTGEVREGITVAVHNDGNWTWPDTGTNLMRLSYHWWDSEGKETVWNGVRTDLPHGLGPGETITLPATIKAPPMPGTYTLEWDMVEEGITWLEWRGSPTLQVSVTVQPRTYEATWLWLSTPTMLVSGELYTNISLTVRNDSTWTWPHMGRHPVRLSYHWWNSRDERVVRDGVRTDLSHDLDPGETTTLAATIKAPSEPGAYTLEWDMVEEGITWFESQRSSPLRLSILVVPG